MGYQKVKKAASASLVNYVEVPGAVNSTRHSPSLKNKQHNAEHIFRCPPSFDQYVRGVVSAQELQPS